MLKEVNHTGLLKTHGVHHGEIKDTYGLPDQPAQIHQEFAVFA